MKWFFIAYLAINALSYLPGVELRVAQEYFFQVSSVLLVACSMFFPSKRLKRDKLNIALCAFFLWLFISYMKSQSGWPMMFNIFMGIMVYFTAIRTLGKEDIEPIIKTVWWIAIAAVIYFGFQLLGWDMRGFSLRATDGLTPKTSFFGIEMAFGGYLAFAMPLILRYSWLALLLFIPMVFSWSSGAVLGAIVGVMLYLWFKKRLAFWFVTPLIITVGILFVVKIDAPMGMMQTRLPMWRIAIQDAHKQVLFGYGPDSFREPKKDGDVRYLKKIINNESIRAIRTGDHYVIPDKISKELDRKIQETGKGFDWWDNPHNLIITLFYEFGFPSLLGAFIFLYFLWQRFIKSKMSRDTAAVFASLAVVLVFSQTQFPFHMARLAHLPPVLLGLFYISTDETKRTDDNS